MSSHHITDLDRVIKEWAWTTYTKTTFMPIDYKHANLEVLWDKITFSADETRISELPHGRKPEANVVFKSTYKNDTEEEHEHTFRAERETVCTSSTLVTKGFTKSLGLDLSLAVPHSVLKATAKFGKAIHVHSTEENTTEHKLSWSIDSKVHAPAKKHTVALLEVNEERYTATFKTDVRFHGDVIVNIRKVKDNSLVKTVENDIATVLRDSRQKIQPDVKIQNQIVIWPVSGELRFSYGVSQNIMVKTDHAAAGYVL